VKKKHKQLDISDLNESLMFLLAVVSVILLIIEYTHTLTPGETETLDAFEIIIGSIFLNEFIVRLALAKSKKKFFKEKWWYLLASIPLSNPFAQYLHVLPFLRIIRLAKTALGFVR
jgi:hypothetical protein